MIILTKKQAKKMKTQMLCLSTASLVMGTAGTVLGTVSLVSCNKEKKRNMETITNIEKHVSAVEAATTKCCKTLVPIQQSMLDNGLLRK